MFEEKVDIDNKQLEQLEAVPSMWLFRSQVSMEGVRQQLYETGSQTGKHEVLQLFLKQVSL